MISRHRAIGSGRTVGWIRTVKGSIESLLSPQIVARFVPYRKPPISAETWDRQYGSGAWDHLAGLAELMRYGAVASYYDHFTPMGAVLDLGCGVGMLQGRLQRVGYARYLGIDISTEAIAAASSRADDRTSFLVADVETFEPERRFDAIIFNEILYYVADPRGLLQRYRRYLNERGFIIVSIFRNVGGLRALKTLEGVAPVVDEVLVRNAAGIEWVVRVYR